jgi:HlyD family secretion protein
VLLLLAIGGTSFGGWYFLMRRQAAPTGLLTHTLAKMKLQITITDRGSLEPADNTFIPCKVKAKSPGQAATSIRWVIDNGSPVKEGDKILELDDSALSDQLGDRLIALYNAKKQWMDAEGMLSTTLLTDQAAIETSENDIKVAEITLQEYLEGAFVQAELDLKNKLAMAATDDFMWAERSKWSDRMSQPGRQFVTVSQAESDAARYKTSQLTMTSLKKQLDVLQNLTKQKNKIDFSGKINVAQLNLKKAKETLELNRKKNEAAVQATKAIYDKEEARLHDLEKEIENCIIRAPRDGMVVYYVEERARFGQSGGVIAQGELVKEGQKMLAVPDLQHMVVNARIHEAMISRVSEGTDEMTDTGFNKAFQGMLLFQPQPLSGWSAYNSFFTPEMQSVYNSSYGHLDKVQTRHGLDASILVNAFQDRPLKGHVKWVSPVASQTDFFSSDVKVYQTYVAIDDDRLEGLKPGMDATITIKVDSTPEPVLAIPLAALLGGVEMGNKRRCFVLVEGHPEMREITLGLTNETHAEVKDGLKEGDEIVVNPAMLLSDKERAEYGVQSNSNSRSGPEGAAGGKGRGQGGKGKGKGRGKGPGGPPGGMPGAPPSGGRSGGFGGGGPRGQGGVSGGGKTHANP